MTKVLNLTPLTHHIKRVILAKKNTFMPLPAIKYRLGPGFVECSNTLSVKLTPSGVNQALQKPIPINLIYTKLPKAKKYLNRPTKPPNDKGVKLNTFNMSHKNKQFRSEQLFSDH